MPDDKAPVTDNSAGKQQPKPRSRWLSHAIGLILSVLSLLVVLAWVLSHYTHHEANWDSWSQTPDAWEESNFNIDSVSGRIMWTSGSYWYKKLPGVALVRPGTYFHSRPAGSVDENIWEEEAEQYGGFLGCRFGSNARGDGTVVRQAQKVLITPYWLVFCILAAVPAWQAVRFLRSRRRAT